MSNTTEHDETSIKQMIENCWTDVNSLTGAERVLAFTTWSLLKEGYYSPNELIDLSLQNKFTLDNPISKIRRGTQIDENAVIKNGTVIDGEHVRVGAGTVLDNAHIFGNEVVIGPNNLISGQILPANISLGSGNEVRELFGNNDGTLIIGNNNKINGVSIHNPGKRHIIIGNHNELHQGLNLNCTFTQGNIRIGDYNSLGNDGGGVISTSYRYNNQWWGDVLIGSHVETTRGAEILGFSLVGWPLSKQAEKIAKNLFVNGPLTEIHSFFATLWNQDLEAQSDGKSISLFGVVKAKMCCLSGTVKVKDDTRIQSSFLKDIIIPERSKVYFTVVDHALPLPLRVSLLDRAIEKRVITDSVDWTQLPTEAQTDGYREEDAHFYMSGA